jgi:hypothetical protein
MAAPVLAQSPGWSGVNPRPINIYPNSTSAFVMPRSVSGAFKPPTQARPLSLTNTFHPFSGLSWPPRLGVNTTPTTFPALPQPQAVQPNPMSQFFQSVGNFLSPY